MFKQDPLFSLTIALITVLAIFFLTYKYTDRIGIAADNSRDVQVAVYAANNGKIPQIGQFSSAGPFFYGPWYYWFLELVTFLPLGALTHWYVITTVYLIAVYIAYWIGEKINGKWLGALAAFYTAISPAQINSSLSTWNPTIIPILAAIQLVLLIKLVQTKRLLIAAALSFVVGLSITIHFQSILTTPILLVALLSISKNPKKLWKPAALMIIAFILPFLPLIYFDAKHNWHNSISFFIFIAVDQFASWVPNSWRIYTTEYWPKTWASIIGGNRIIALAIVAILSVGTIIQIKNIKKLPASQAKGIKIFLSVTITFVLEFLLYRYYRGQRFNYYSFFAHPAVLILTAWVTYKIIKFNKLLGITIFAIISIGSIQAATGSLKPGPTPLARINNLKSEIYNSYPNDNFDIYGCVLNPEEVSHPLALFMYRDGRNNPNGIKIGVCLETDAPWRVLTPEDFLSIKTFWYNRSTPNVYHETVEWWQDKPPGKGDFLKFLKEKLSPRCYPHC